MMGPGLLFVAAEANLAKRVDLHAIGLLEDAEFVEINAVDAFRHLIRNGSARLRGSLIAPVQAHSPRN